MIKNIYGKHTFYFTVLTIILSIIAFLLKIIFLFKSINSFIFCLFLILSVGISHGAMDNYKANKF